MAVWAVEQNFWIVTIDRSAECKAWWLPNVTLFPVFDSQLTTLNCLHFKIMDSAWMTAWRNLFLHRIQHEQGSFNLPTRYIDNHPWYPLNDTSMPWSFSYAQSRRKSLTTRVSSPLGSWCQKNRTYVIAFCVMPYHVLLVQPFSRHYLKPQNLGIECRRLQANLLPFSLLSRTFDNKVDLMIIHEMKHQVTSRLSLRPLLSLILPRLS